MRKIVIFKMSKTGQLSQFERSLEVGIVCGCSYIIPSIP